jgi:streptogramin lyase
MPTSASVVGNSNTVTVTTLAGSGNSAYVDGQGILASFYTPAGVAVDGSGNVYVADSGNNALKKIIPDGTVIPILTVNFPRTVSVDGSGNVYVSSEDSVIYKITPDGYDKYSLCPIGQYPLASNPLTCQ